MKEFIEKIIDKLTLYSIILGLIFLALGIVNRIKGDIGYAKSSFIAFGISVLIYLVCMYYSRASEKMEEKKSEQLSPVTNITAEQLTVLGMVVLLEHPLRFENDKKALIQSIFEQQVKEYKRAIAPSAPIQITIAGADIDDEAYIYGKCRVLFDELGSYKDNDEFLQRVATGSFKASDGNRGKHFAFLNRRI